MSSPWKDFPNDETERPFEGIPAGQEPEVMPGFTAPATDPWPPLSREQVVELHEALIEFLKAPMRAPNRLAMRLLALNIGTPPQPRRWTDDDIQAALEKREAADPTGFQAPPVHYVQQERETIDRIRDSMTDDQFVAFCWGNVMKYRDRSDSKGDPEADTRKALWYERMMLHVAVGSADPRSDRPNFQPYRRQPSDMPLVWVETAPAPTASLVSSPLGVKHNCWTCSRAVRGKIGCDLMANHGWLNMLVASARCGMDLVEKSQKADHCPGWEAKP